uniref:Uncharacterized protein n=1 Tax=Brassica campestris TaxID=3711 RepID=A0A3P5YF38_BRACM|nr:unnamed protein product [Brassica rapa]
MDTLIRWWHHQALRGYRLGTDGLRRPRSFKYLRAFTRKKAEHRTDVGSERSQRNCLNTDR